MKKFLFTTCVIIALLLALGSFSIALTQVFKDAVPNVESESIVETEPAPVIKTFTLYSYGTGGNNPDSYPGFPLIFSYEEGMTWAEWLDSSYNTGELSLGPDDVSVCHGSFALSVVLSEHEQFSYEYPDIGDAVKVTDTIDQPFYGFED